MEELLAFGVFCFVSLFAMIEPLGTMPMFISMTSSMSPAKQRATARKAVLVAYITLLTFAFTGQLIFRFFGISVESLKVVGGILFFLIGYEMLQAKLSHTHTAKEKKPVTTEADADLPPEPEPDISLTPLGIPLIAGPGAIANVIVLWNEAGTVLRKMMVLLAITLVLVLTLLIFLGARRVARFLGDEGNKVLLRLMGLITMVIAVEFFFSGLTPIVRKMLHPPEIR
ncbi:MarC family protein [Zavarzinella formosa]|uniref:MarC family protein n=1 Tax=Zavarzinella formosa TaxID=360055 RepID=UPI000379FE96|nr:NAAT family transporter [Zavarzinella formosa]